MSTISEKSETTTISSRFTQEEIERRIYEDGKRFYQEYKEFWKPLMQEQRKQQENLNNNHHL
ncbi:MAG: hypothetical protein LBT09_05360 [Planctomycetaceae bacterium]|jgi:hypothetical protein|nr:hypothetical protein [Planctomycetaceae bacterium]